MQVLYGMDYIAEERHVQHNLLRAALLEHVRQAPESRERPGAGPWWGPGEARVAAGAAGAGTALCLSCACIAGAAAIVATLAPGHLPVSPPPSPHTPLPPPKTRSSLISLQFAVYTPPPSSSPVLVVEEYDKLDCHMRGFFRQLLENGRIANVTLNRLA